MSAAIQTLTNAKEALDAQLITKADFDTVKDAFLRAQQLKAGLDAGFILEADYQHVKHAFFESLRIGSAPAATSALSGCQRQSGCITLSPTRPAQQTCLQTTDLPLSAPGPQALSRRQHPLQRLPHVLRPRHPTHRPRLHSHPRGSLAHSRALHPLQQRSSRMQGAEA